MEITASLVKELRERTGAAMMDCKNALKETAGSIEDAIQLLREKGAIKAAKKGDRIAAEGLIAFAVSADHRKPCWLKLIVKPILWRVLKILSNLHKKWHNWLCRIMRMTVSN